MSSHVTKYPETLSLHFTCAQPLQQYRCKDCPLRTPLVTILNNHVENKHQTTPRSFECRSCNGFRTLSKLVLLKHSLLCVKKLKHLKRLQHNGVYKCRYCSLKTKFPGNLTRHMKLRHTPLEDIRWYTCDQCGFQAKQKDNIKSHKIARHLPPGKIQWFVCDKCPYRGKKLSALKGHVMSLHTAEEDIQWYECDRCCFKSKKKFNLQVHVKRMHEEGRGRGGRRKGRRKKL
ncbi:hypothetical protein Zmor_022578 [Zophobas morio]|uniref:Protein hunchback n=1 Tax=Zophobas morio TaxID=2755281 RepID=A0AA38HYV8_9CUCU|nr:hypothetical protein Zmor_022578 [Zophobas morio]